MLSLPLVLAQNPDPVIVRIQDPPSEIAGVADVLIRALGFVGFLAVLAVLTALMVGGFIFWRRSRAD